MRKVYLAILLSGLLLFKTFNSEAQVALPYTLNFTSNDATNWADGIAQDGDGGTQNILGLDLQIYTAGTDHTTLYTFPGNIQSTIEWYDNSYYYSNSSSYTGITSGPSVPATNNGVPAMVIKSANSAQNFSLISIQLYDWGYTNVITIETYDNGTKKGSVDFTPDPSYNPTKVSQSDLLTPALFSDIDEIRFFPKSAPVFNLSFNNIELAAAGTLPVTFNSVKATRQNKNINVEWKVANQTSIEKYEVERSADGISFEYLGTEKATGNSAADASYNWIDENPLPGNNFYRVKSIDKSGRDEYSTIAKLNFGAGISSLSVYPNPATGGTVRLQMKDMAGGSYHLKLVNSEGKVLIQKDLVLPPGNSNETLNISQLPKGIYQVRIITPDHTTIDKSIVH
ncbi:MAG TPA: T9SS type A sorting domain-containing protein [Hanamia sp.]|nr:T9SS type A sorting domain-containing protein [Hanamia sp.]